MRAPVNPDDAPLCAPPDPATRTPRLAMPPLACDCHAHICGPMDQYPCSPTRIYTPPDAGLDRYRSMLSVLGVTRAVLVQPSFYGTDNAALVHALRAGGASFRGVAVVAADIAERELERLHQAGVRGVRINIVDTRQGKGALPIDQLRRLAERVRPFGWHMEFLAHVNEFPDLDRLLAGFPVDVVFGHLGYVPTIRGTGDAGFCALLRLLGEGRAWVKLTGPYRISEQSLPFTDTAAFARALLDTAPQRVLWGSDWPHVKAAWSIPMPNDGDLADLLLDWAPDPKLRRGILVDNPALLYGFANPDEGGQT
jgi:2-pyrone-4,6-dicarboxylate lactonase